VSPSQAEIRVGFGRKPLACPELVEGRCSCPPYASKRP